MDRDVELASLAAQSGGRSRLNTALASIYAGSQTAAGASPSTSHISIQPELSADAEQPQPPQQLQQPPQPSQLPPPSQPPINNIRALPVSPVDQQQQQRGASGEGRTQASMAGGQAGSRPATNAQQEAAPRTAAVHATAQSVPAPTPQDRTTGRLTHAACKDIHGSHVSFWLNFQGKIPSL